MSESSVGLFQISVTRSDKPAVAILTARIGADGKIVSLELEGAPGANPADTAYVAHLLGQRLPGSHNVSAARKKGR